MSEQTDATSVTEETNGQAAEFAAITSQEEFDKAIQARIARERAKFADYEQVKSDAAELAKIRESQKTAEQKQAEELAKAQATIAELTTARVRAEVAAAKGVPAALLTGSTQEELEAAADALIAFKGDQAKGPIIPDQGKTPGSLRPNPGPGVPRLAAAFDEAIN